MSDRNFLLVAALAFIIGILWFYPAGAKAQSTQKPPGDWTLYEEDIWIVLVDEPEFHFQKAHEFFLKKDFKAAGSEIRKGAAFLKLEAGRSTTEGKKTLEASADELGKLAEDVEKGAVASEKQLKDAFARADHALAKHHYLKGSGKLIEGMGWSADEVGKGINELGNEISKLGKAIEPEKK
ncbi:MAG: hypothetical protein AMJ90_04065 [candidate division Zixibacteria bacterium SM23_73_2]|nr:MAG: hypothetical protein AMJ90_04065 [candidate division Zixibacteria bacterium SM23_73_2]